MDITQRILYLKPDAKFMCRENDYYRIDWHQDNPYPKPSLEELSVVTEANLAERKLSLAKQEAGNIPDHKVAVKALAQVTWNYSPSLKLAFPTYLDYQNAIINRYKDLI